MGIRARASYHCILASDPVLPQFRSGMRAPFSCQARLFPYFSILVGLAYIVSQGNITATIIWFAITTGATAGLSYNKEKQ